MTGIQKSGQRTSFRQTTSLQASPLRKSQIVMLQHPQVVSCQSVAYSSVPVNQSNTENVNRHVKWDALQLHVYPGLACNRKIMPG